MTGEAGDFKCLMGSTSIPRQGGRGFSFGLCQVNCRRNGSLMVFVRRSIVLLLVFLFVVMFERGCSVPAPWELGMVMFASTNDMSPRDTSAPAD